MQDKEETRNEYVLRKLKEQRDSIINDSITEMQKIIRLGNNGVEFTTIVESIVLGKMREAPIPVQEVTPIEDEELQLLKEEDILSLGWERTPDVTDYPPQEPSYIIGDDGGYYYELSNEDKDNVWCIQECDEKGNYTVNGENMMFILRSREDLRDLMRLTGIN